LKTEPQIVMLHLSARNDQAILVHIPNPSFLVRKIRIYLRYASQPYLRTTQRRDT